MNDTDFKAAIEAALQSVVQQAGRAVNYSFAATPEATPPDVTGTVSPQ